MLGGYEAEYTLTMLVCQEGQSCRLRTALARERVLKRRRERAAHHGELACASGITAFQKGGRGEKAGAQPPGTTSAVLEVCCFSGQRHLHAIQQQAQAFLKPRFR